MISDSKPARAQRALDAEHLVADRVAVAERRENLMDAGRPAACAPSSQHRARRAASTRPVAPAARCGAAARTSPAAAPCARRGLALQPLEHVEVLALDHRPRVVAAEELAAVAAEHGAERAGGLEQVQRLGELLERSRSTARALLRMHWPRSTSQWPLASTGLPSAQASSATIDRLSNCDGMISTSAAASASNLSSSEQEAEMPDARMLRNRRARLEPIRTRSRPRGYIDRVALEVREQLRAALVLVDAADVDRERALHVELLPESATAACARESPIRRRRRRPGPRGR